MGNSACGCGPDTDNNKQLLYDIPNEDWSNAVNNLSLAGVKMLHQQDPETINECVSSDGYIAIHIAVQKQDFELFRYLLKYGGDINALCGDDGNSCLHLAVINKDIAIIRELFNCDIDDTLLNNNGKTAMDLITDNSFRRQYMRAKNNHRYDTKDTKDIKDTKGINCDTSIGGMLVNDLSNNQLAQIIKDSNGEINKEINNNYITTTFGQEIGCDVDEIAYQLQQLKTNKIWDKWVKKKKIIKTHDLLKVIYGLTVLTLKNRRKQQQEQQQEYEIKPPSEPIKRLTAKIYKMLPKYKSSQERKKRHVLTRKDFINNFHIYLYNAHNQFVNEQDHIHETNVLPKKLQKIT